MQKKAKRKRPTKAEIKRKAELKRMAEGIIKALEGQPTLGTNHMFLRAYWAKE